MQKGLTRVSAKWTGRIADENASRPFLLQNRISWNTRHGNPPLPRATNLRLLSLIDIGKIEQSLVGGDGNGRNHGRRTPCYLNLPGWWIGAVAQHVKSERIVARRHMVELVSAV